MIWANSKRMQPQQGACAGLRDQASYAALQHLSEAHHADLQRLVPVGGGLDS